jgi:peptidyl-prolyl cis-trans isomerase SurA
MQMGFDPTKNPQKFEEMKQITIENLIVQKILLLKAEEDTVEVEDHQIESMLEQQMQGIIQQLGSPEKVEEYFGTTLSKIRRNYREEIEKNLKARAVQETRLLNERVSRREVEEFYNTNKDSLPNVKETVELSHILIEVKPGEEAKRKSLEKIKGIRARIEAGEDFPELAKELSEDPGSAQNGGDLGFMSRGNFVREFEEVAFSLQPDELSDIVETQFGFHIIQMIDRRGEKIRVRHILVTLETSEEDELLAVEKIKDIHTQLMNGADFEELVLKYSEDKSTINEKGHLGTYELDQLRQTAKEFVYAIKDVNPGEISEPVHTQYGYHVLRVNSRQAERPLDLKTDWDRIEMMALEQKRQREFQKWIAELKQDVYIEIKSTD